MRTRDRPVAAGVSRFWICAPGAALLLAIGYSTLGPAPAHETLGAALPTGAAPLAGDAAAHTRPPPLSREPDAGTGGHHAAATQLTPGVAEMGLASWFDVPVGEMAGSESMGARALKAAHPSLPLGSRALVENVKNGQIVVVRITGREPLAAGRIIDLSKAAAERLDLIGDGAATVRVRRVDDTHARGHGRSDIIE